MKPGSKQSLKTNLPLAKLLSFHSQLFSINHPPFLCFPTQFYVLSHLSPLSLPQKALDTPPGGGKGEGQGKERWVLNKGPLSGLTKPTRASARHCVCVTRYWYSEARGDGKASSLAQRSQQNLWFRTGELSTLTLWLWVNQGHIIRTDSVVRPFARFWQRFVKILTACMFLFDGLLEPTHSMPKPRGRARFLHVLMLWKSLWFLDRDASHCSVILHFLYFMRSSRLVCFLP